MSASNPEKRFTFIFPPDPETDKTIRAGQILEDILKPMRQEQETDFLSSGGKILSQKDVVDAVALAFNHGEIVVFIKESAPPVPVKIVQYFPKSKSADTPKPTLGIQFDPTFFRDVTPDTLPQYLKSGQIDSWVITKKLFKLIRDKIVME